MNETELIKSVCAERLRAIFLKGIPECAAERLECEIPLLNTPSRTRPLLLYHKLSEAAISCGGAIKALGSINGLYTLFLLGNSSCDPLPAHYYCNECGYSEFLKTRLFGIDLPEKLCPRCGKIMSGDGYRLDVFSTRITEEGYVPVMEYRVSSGFLEDALKTALEYAEESRRIALPLISGTNRGCPSSHVGYIILPDGKTPGDYADFIEHDDKGAPFVMYGEQGRYLYRQCGAEQVTVFESRQLSAYADASGSLRRATELSVDELLRSNAFSDDELDILKEDHPESFIKLCELLTLSKCSFEDGDSELVRTKMLLRQDFFKRMPIYSSDDVFEYLAERGFDKATAHRISEYISMGRGAHDPDFLYELNAPEELIELSRHCRYLWPRAAMAERLANMLVEFKED